MKANSTAAIRPLPAICATLAILALALSACGGGGATDSRPAAQAGAGAAQVIAPVGRAKARAAAACRTQLGDFIGSMERLRRRLAVGLSYHQYATAVEGVRAHYEALSIPGLPPHCVVVSGAAGERAFNRYIEAANAWGECLANSGCDSTVVEPQLQREWRIASHFLSRAQVGLKG